MRVLIISDIHANLPALRSLPAADAIICAGDVVGFGPDPSGVVAELMRLDVKCVRGEEDDAVARVTKQHPVPPALVHTAKALREHARASLSTAQMRWLRALPPELELTLDGVRIGMTHAYPGDYTRYVAPTPEELSRTIRAFPHCAVVVVGHTHRRGTWKGRALVVNPGSVGMPQRAGYASYAFLEGGKVRFGSSRYDPSETLAEMRKLDIGEEAYLEYEHELTRGSLRPHQRLARSPS
jgi:putative phosphoesterase